MMLSVVVRHKFAGFSLDAMFEAAAGITVLFGPSGCGKSTVLAAIAGLLRPGAGRVAIGGIVVLDTAARVFVPPEQRRCGMVFQDALLFPHLSVLGNLRFGMRRAPRDCPSGEMAAEAEIVDLLGLGQLLKRRPLGLSGGERQRVALGRALLSRPRLLLLDEPLAALDDARRAEVLPFLERVRDELGLPVLYVTHALEEVDRLADTLVLMQAGRVLAAGSVEALSTRTDLPLAAGRDAGAVLACRVAGHDASRGLSLLAFDGGELAVPLQPFPSDRIRVRVRARDVAVALREPRGVSVQNVLPAVLQATKITGDEALLTLGIGNSVVLLARVTRDAVSRLGLVPGLAVWAMVKSVSFGA